MRRLKSIPLLAAMILLFMYPFSLGLAANEKSGDYTIVEFPSEGAILKGRLYMPESEEKVAIIIMAHGYSATIDGMVADRYAERFYQAGYAVLLYDHRNFGIRGGEPRQEINAWIQGRGYRDAIDYVYSMVNVDTNRVAIWGDSMSGGEVVCVAALDHRVNAVIGQVPSFGKVLNSADLDGSRFAMIRDIFENGDVSGTPENTIGPIPVVSYSPELVPAMMKPMTAFRWFTEYGGRYGTNWKNQVTHVTPNLPEYFDPGLCIRHIAAPILLIVAYDDEMPYVESEPARQAFAIAPEPKQLYQIEGGHFGLVEYPSALFDEASEVQIEFLEKHFQ